MLIMKDVTRKGSIKRNMLTPLAFIAVSSLKLEDFPATKSAAKRTDTGVIRRIISGAKTR